jgi:N-methylhydantoinase A
VVKAFHAEHFKTYGHASTTDPIELVNVRVTGTLANARSARYDGSQASHGMAPAAMPVNRQAYFGKAHGLIDTPVIQRRDLSESPIHGPVIVEEYDATCVVPPGAQVAIDSHHNILISMPGAV